MSEVNDNRKPVAERRLAPVSLFGADEAYAAGVEAGRKAERQDCWDAINKRIKRGVIPGNGFDETAQRNGMILASNLIMERIAPNAPDQRVRPKLVCVCGSLRFRDEFERQELAHLMRGEIALLPCCMHVDIQRAHGEMSDYKERADARHKQLIDLADEVLVLNVGGYVGNSTLSEIIYANRAKKPLRWLEQSKCPCCNGDEDCFECALCHGSGSVGGGGAEHGESERERHEDETQNAEVSEGGTRDSQIETAVQSLPSLH